jgi:hypothetical protein
MTEVGHVKLRKTLLIMLLLLFAGGLTIYAKTAGLSVSFNKYNSIAAVESDGMVYLDLEETAEKMYAMIVRDGTDVALHKPNVNIATISQRNFQDFFKGRTSTFYAHVAVDGLEHKISEIMLTISTPYNKGNEYDKVLLSLNKSDDAFQSGEKFVITTQANYYFEYAGKYYLRFWMKPEGGDRFYVVGEKALYIASP